MDMSKIWMITGVSSGFGRAIDIVFFANDVQENGTMGFLDDLISFFRVVEPHDLEKVFDP
jgi:hypothetical protein